MMKHGGIQLRTPTDPTLDRTVCHLIQSIGLKIRGFVNVTSGDEDAEAGVASKDPSLSLLMLYTSHSASIPVEFTTRKNAGVMLTDWTTLCWL